MMQPLREAIHSLRASPIFAFYVLVTLGLVGVVGLMVFLMQVRPGFMGMTHGTELHHRVHDLTFAVLVTTGAIGILVQLRRPSENVAGMLLAVIPWGALVLTFAITNTWVFAPLPVLGALTLIATLLHPTGRGFFRSFSVSRISWVMLAMVISAAVPLLALATVNDDHAALGHYGFMAAFSFTVIAVGFLASLRSDGWRLTAWVAGLLLAFLGLASVMYPDVSSSLDPVWRFAAIAWGVGFVAAAELTRNAEGRAPLGLRSVLSEVEPVCGTTTGSSRWQKVVGTIGLVLVLGLGILVFGLSDGGLGPGMGTADGGQEQEIDGENREDHTPSEGGHG